MEEQATSSPSVTPPPDTSAQEPAQSHSPTPPSQSAPKHSKNRFIWIFVLIVFFLGFLAVAAWYFQNQLQKTALENKPTTEAPAAMSPKELIIGTDPTLPPMEFLQNGKFVGYDIDLANLLAKQMGVKVEFKNVVFDNIFSALQDHQIDLIVSAVTITPDRQAKYDFSEQYLNAGQVIITRKDNTTITSVKDLQGKKIGVQKGTTNETQALKYTSSTLVIRYPDFVQATKALVNGQVDAIFDDLPSSKGITQDNPTLKIASDPFTDEYYGIVFRKGDPEVKEVNKALDALRVRGYLTELKNKWLD